MDGSFLLLDYFKWHYSTAISAWWRIYLNLLWFLAHFFSISVLLGTFFSPWRRLAEAYPRGFNPQASAETLIVNLLMRAIGLVFRSAVLLTAVSVLLAAFVVGPVLLLLWLVAPFVSLLFLIVGFYLTFLP